MTIALALLIALQAGKAPDPAQAPVVVTGRRLDEAKAVRHMTARIAPLADASQPLPRFAAPICPQVDGVPMAVAHHFAERMRVDARAAGVAVDGEGCAPNITVLFVPNGQEVVRALHKTHSEMFGTLEPAQIRRLADDAGPIHQWSFTELKSRDDDRPRVATDVARDAPELQVRQASIIEAPARIVVDGSILLIDQQASIGKTIDQLADYAVMRVLAQARPIGDAAGEPTILRLFDKAEPVPRGLTPFDAAYLKAFYQGSGTTLPMGKISMMAHSINKTLAQAVATSGAEAPPAK